MTFSLYWWFRVRGGKKPSLNVQPFLEKLRKGKAKAAGEDVKAEDEDAPADRSDEERLETVRSYDKRASVQPRAY